MVVFQTPPEPTPTYQTFGLVGSTAISAMRPDINAGPMLLKGNAEINPELIFESTFGVGFCWAIAKLAVMRHKLIDKGNALSVNGLCWNIVAMADGLNGKDIVK